MDTTDEAEPTITSPMMQSSVTTTSRTVETGSCHPHRRTTELTRLGAALRGLAATPEAPRDGVTTRSPRAHTGRATTMLGPTPGAWRHFSARSPRSGGGCPRSRELRHGEEVAIE